MRNLLLLGLFGVASASCPTGQHFNNKLNVCEIEKPEGGCTSQFPYLNEWIWGPDTCTTVEMPPAPYFYEQAGKAMCTWVNGGTVAEDCLMNHNDGASDHYTYCKMGQKFYRDGSIQTCGPPCTIGTNLVVTEDVYGPGAQDAAFIPQFSHNYFAGTTCYNAAPCPANASLGVGALAEGASVQVSCPAGKVGVRVVTCEQEVQQVNDDGCRDIADLKDNTKKQEARQALKTAMPDKAKVTVKAEYNGTSDKTSEVYKKARTVVLKAAKQARNEYLTIQINSGVDWKDAVIEDEDDVECYSDAVLEKRKAKLEAKKVDDPDATYPIRYRKVPDLGADSCNFDQPDIELTIEEGMDLLDPEKCVTAKVEGELGVIRMTKDGDVFDLECNDGSDQDDMEIGSEFTCQGRVWDIGSVSSDPNDPVVTAPSTCPEDEDVRNSLTAAEYINAQCCQCL